MMSKLKSKHPEYEISYSHRPLEFEKIASLAVPLPFPKCDKQRLSWAELHRPILNWLSTVTAPEVKWTQPGMFCASLYVYLYLYKSI